MRVGNVTTRPGRPMMACDPNSAMALTKASSVPDRTAGATSGSVIETAVRSLLAPRIWAASSYEASTDCSALEASRNTNGNVCITVTRTRPVMEKMLNVSHGRPATSRTSTLISPALGLNRYTKAIAVRNGGDR